MDQGPATSIRVGELLIDPGKREVRLAGRALKLPRLSYQLLLALIDEAPNVVTHEALMERVWPGKVVSPETLTQRVKLLRDVIGDQADSPRYIGLVRGEGYRFLIEPVPVESTDGEEPGRKPVWPSMAAIALVIAVFWLLRIPTPTNVPEEEITQRIAVLPFTNASGDESSNYISEGLSNELIDQLGRYPDLKVAARTSAIAAAQETDSIDVIAEKLGVQRLIQGRVHRIGDDLRVAVQIVNAQEGFEIWSHTYQRRTEDLLSIHRQLAKDVSRQLLPNTLVLQSPLTRSIRAHDLFLLARYYDNKVRDRNIIDEKLLQRAIEYYAQANQIDPESPLLQSYYGSALLYAGRIEEAQTPIFTALELNAELSEVQTTVASYYWITRQAGSGPALKRAIELNPNNADALSSYASWIWHQGESYQPSQYYRSALDADPLSLRRYVELGNYYALNNRREDALQTADRIKSVFANAEGYSAIARIHDSLGDYIQAFRWAQRAHESNPDEPSYRWQLAELYALVGDFEQASRYEPNPGIGLLFHQRKHEEMISLGQDLLLELPTDLQVKYLLAFAYNASGRYTEAIRALQLAGLPDRTLSDTRLAADLEALSLMADAYDRSGQSLEAGDLAKWLVTFFQTLIDTGGRTAWSLSYQACMFAVLGEREAALRNLRDIEPALGLRLLTSFRDRACFRTLAETPEYQNLIRSIEQFQSQVLDSLV